MGDAPSCYIRVRCPGQAPVVHRVNHFPCRIGRVDGNEIVIRDSSISSLHAVLILQPNNLIQLEDQWSTNGIYLNTRRVSQLLVDRMLSLTMGNVKVDLVLTDEELRQLESKSNQSSTSVKINRDRDNTSTVMLERPSLSRAEVLHPDARANALKKRYMMGDSPAATISRIAGSGRRGIVCPHCWHRFDIDEFLFIARHQSLLGDPVLGPDAQQRFLPSRFTLEGNALDASGMSCPDMACPRCHLRIPQAASEMPPLFLSIVGATSSGKSYFLTSMSWELRNTLSRNFAISFADTDAVNNHLLNNFEETLFLNSDQEALVALRKTELQGELYNQVLLDNMMINLPKPFMFTVTPAEHHPKYQEVREKMSRTLVLYDNAGEHFEPGMDLVDNPTTQHLLHSDTIFFLFDPTKDVRFRRLISGVNDPQLDSKARVQRQEIILTEMINRIKKYSGMKTGSRTGKTLVVVISKFDVWKQLLEFDLPKNPWRWESMYNTCVIDVNLIKNISFQLRNLLEDICPELISTAESFAGEVLYLPNSALGHSPELNDETGMIGIRPGKVNPFWVTVPMLYFFYQRGFIPPVPAESQTRMPEAEFEMKLSGDIYFVRVPGREKPLQVPLSYAGWQLRCPGTDLWFTVPEPQRAE